MVKGARIITAEGSDAILVSKAVERINNRLSPVSVNENNGELVDLILEVGDQPGVFSLRPKDRCVDYSGIYEIRNKEGRHLAGIAHGGDDPYILIREGPKETTEPGLRDSHKGGDSSIGEYTLFMNPKAYLQNAAQTLSQGDLEKGLK
jgi:hypothetical protein